MKAVRLVEGVSQADYLNKARNNEKEFKYEESDDDSQRNKKDTMKLVYSPYRFIMGQMYHSLDLEVLTNYEKLAGFVKRCVIGDADLYWESELVKRQKYSLKVVGEDFQK